jgi:peroxiredoxin family protein
MDDEKADEGIEHPSIDEFISLAQEMGIKWSPCSTSCGILGLPDDAFRDGIMSQAGAAYFLAQAVSPGSRFFLTPGGPYESG